VAEYEVPTVPLGNVAVVSCKGAGLLAGALTVIASDTVAACGEASESLAWRVNVLCPAELGLPLMLPLADNVRPAGSEPETTLHV
jgi:hypothetical protein